MQEVIAGLEKIIFDLEDDVENQTGIGFLPFPGMDKSGVAVCTFFLKGLCEKGKLCPFRHDDGEKTVVCKHWLRGLCKKSDQCKFLHQYDTTRMPECYFYSKFGECCNKECLFLHADPASKIQNCPWYDQGFCKYGPLCKFRHMRRVLCTNYLAGFCPEGPGCRFAHPKMTLLLRKASHSKNVSQPQGPTKLDSIVETSERGQQESPPAEVSSKPTVSFATVHLL
ncbi:putative cleavage and polyadenylation specificity factor subunit 4-like protein [Phascolarctos cinereus]|uniref:Cleavage and polyadenylation specificity factor subunit 4 n=1 Tax=Phascolarctos cinereus TaxID=38626 RepID=A0A6P5LP97_PHACI|nr:putative cleavage and polyadenylation specificity factor subunit 4-like protein [Phascolarctos cinereus]